MLTDELIDKILFEHKNDEALTQTLTRLGFIQPKGAKWAQDLHELEIFEIYGAPDYLQLTKLGKDAKAKGGWAKIKKPQPSIPLFDRILSELYERQDDDGFQNLFVLLKGEDKNKLRNKVKELELRGFIKREPAAFHTTVYFSDGTSSTKKEDEATRKRREEKYENELNVKITWEGIQYVKGQPFGTTITTITDNSTNQNITNSTIHGPANQSTESSMNKTIVDGGANKKSALKTVGGIVGTLASVVTVILFLIGYLNNARALNRRVPFNNCYGKASTRFQWRRERIMKDCARLFQAVRCESD